MRSLVLSVLLCLLVSPLVADTLPPKETIDALLAESGLEKASRPWHLKVSVNYSSGVKAEIEEWFSSPTKRKTTISTDGFHQTVYETDKGRFVEGDGGAAPIIISQLLERIHHPAPSTDELSDVVYQRETLSFGKVKLDCIMAAHPVPKADKLPMGLFPTYCFDLGTPRLRAVYLFGGTFYIINGSGSFLGNQVPMKTALSQEGKVLAEANVIQLQTMTAEETSFTPPPTAIGQSTEGLHVVPAGVLAGQILSKIPPVYPASARQGHVSGTVLLQAIIGRDGHIYSLKVVKSPDPDLTIAAIDAVRRWTYKPYLLNGEPVSIDTQITVNFQIN